MRSKNAISKLVFTGLALIMVFAPLAWGAVQLWSMTLIAWVAGLLLFLWFWRMNNDGTWALRPTRLDGPIWVFVALAVTSIVYGIYPYAGNLSMIRLFSYVAVYYLVVHYFDWRWQLRFFVLIITIGASLSLFGIGQYFFELNNIWWNNFRNLSATYVNHSHFAGYLEMAILLNLALLLGLRREDVTSTFDLSKYRLLLVGTLSVMLTAFILSLSRGGWIVLAMACLIGCYYLVRRKILSKRAAISFTAVLFLFIGFLGFGEDRVAYKLHTIEVGEDSKLFKGRWEVWERSLKIVKDYPINGTGIGTFVWAFSPYRPKDFTVRYHYAHNDYIQMMVEMGILVLPVMLWGMYHLVKKGFEHKAKDHLLRRMMHLGCGVGMFSLICHGFVDFNFHIPANMLLFVCLAGIVMR